MSETQTLCPCGKQLDGTPAIYEECCQPFHLKQAIPEHPEALMRSRYSAYYLGLGQYIFDTHHASYRGNTTVDEFTASAKNTNWCGLEVIAASEEGDRGTVEFKACLIDKDKLHTLHEISNFIRENHRWYYTDGKFQPKTVQKINRNQACPCGSGLKAKRCCLS
ncbi:YchJ family protein [Kangiella sediminilitoris]|uniref:SEC-C motif domain protein n=1 Tax=Kangiella sediminilitoris TaxID=1144748 RepID=A0A1B3B9F9_9GAMM|nr:YchJ family metal-binding protein [Kangiella sediminilitoris]AOE49432.1 SEC-C motif domain protein [Kangiella sediminilitoris]